MEINHEIVRLCVLNVARQNMAHFAKVVNPELVFTRFHRVYYDVLDMFAKKKIHKLMVSVPPQHGKSEGSSRILPSFMFGCDPSLKIVIGSYSGALSSEFNRDIQKIMLGWRYAKVFPKSRLRLAKYGAYRRTIYTFDIPHQTGRLITVGRTGGLTGRSADVVILDDVFQDYMEANSPVIRDNIWRWYTTVVKTRLHNESQQLLVFTRWNEEDLIGKLCETEKVVPFTSFKELENADKDTWVKVNFEAIKESVKTEIDPREQGEPLWPERHSLEKLLEAKRIDKVQFDCLYQGHPGVGESLLYKEFQTYEELPTTYGNGNYTDTADQGNDYMCSISYRKGKGKVYVTDVVYTQEPMEECEKLIPLMLKRSDTRYAFIESNSGGGYFAQKLQKLTPAVNVISFTQNANKEARVLTNTATVNQSIVMPYDWHYRWPTFARHVTYFKRLFKANRYDDAPDVLTGIVEKEIVRKEVKIY